MSPDPRRTWVCDLARAVSTISLRTAFAFVTYSYSLEFTGHKLYYGLIDISSRWIRSGGLCHVNDHFFGTSQIRLTNLRFASVSPSMYFWVVARLAWPTSCWTSRRLPPAEITAFAARVTKVRRPEWLEAPPNPSVRKRSWNQSATAPG